MSADNLGARMKGYEEAARMVLPGRMPMIVRIDGRAFHTFTKSFTKPWDTQIRDGLTAVASALIREVPGAKIAYCQSDEVTVLVTDYDRLGFEPWFGKAVVKICSVAASIATAAFNKAVTHPIGSLATFDARAFVLPKEEVANAFVWRQIDAERNSVLGYAQSWLSHKQMQGKDCKTLRAMMEASGVPWEARATWEKRGWCVSRKVIDIVHDGQPAKRTVVEPDYEAPRFSQDRAYIERHVYLQETEPA